MLSKKFYDVLSVLFIISFIVEGIFMISSLDNAVSVSPDKVDEAVNYIVDLQFIFFISVFIYGIFIVILAFQMHKKGLVSTADTVFIILFIPLNIVFYFVTLRKHFNEISVE